MAARTWASGGDGHAGAFQFGADLPGQLDRTGRVPVQEDGVGDDRQVGAGDCFDEPFADHPDGAVHNGRGVVDDGAGAAARHQGAVCLISPVCDAHDGHRQLPCCGGVGQFAVLGEDDQVRVDAGGGVGHGFGVIGAGGHQVAEAAVGCDVGDGGAVVRGEGAEGAELVEDVVADFIGGEVHGAAAKAAEVGEARVRPDADAAADAFGDRGVHDVRVSCVESTGNVGAGNHLEQCRVVAHRVGAEAFSEIRHEINCGSHVSPPGVLAGPRRSGARRSASGSYVVAGNAPSSGSAVRRPGLPGICQKVWHRELAHTKT